MNEVSPDSDGPVRSTPGLENEAALLGVDAVVWTEGGRNDPNLPPPDRAEDLQFWHLVFSQLKKNKTFHFKPTGSKNRVREIAQMVSTQKLANVVACMDRDQDWITQETIVDNNVVYSRGYSWENDVWTHESVFESFRRIYAGNEKLAEAQAVLEDRRRHFEQKLKWHIRADCLRAKGEPRQLAGKGKRIVCVEGLNLPRISCAPLFESKFARRAKGIALTKRQRVVLQNVHLLCVGHIVADYYFHVLRWLLRRYCKINSLQKEVARAQLVTLFSSYGFRRPEIRRFYRTQLAELRLSTISLSSPDIDRTQP